MLFEFKLFAVHFKVGFVLEGKLSQNVGSIIKLPERRDVCELNHLVVRVKTAYVPQRIDGTYVFLLRIVIAVPDV